MTSDDTISTKKFSDQLLLLETKRMDLSFLKTVVSDLRCYRKMIGVKKYD
ncbi:MAG: hypothetical protein ABSB89_09835 [Candidatus Bathyarchaeia archaeon]|jgi:hypothetical protein